VENGAKVAIVTGSAGGIGEATGAALALAQRGCRAVVANLRAEAAREAAARLGAAGFAPADVAVDVGDQACVNARVERVIARWGRIDILVNNAGIESSSPFLASDEASFVTGHV
jgi:NAD(P)-dependent dehydrogenase (short-subunit alcohol dehydrogenase family)